MKDEGSKQKAVSRRQKAQTTLCLYDPRFLPTAYCLLPTAYCLLPTAYCLLPSAYCLLPTAYCLLPTAYCLLLTAFCFHPSSLILAPSVLLSNLTFRSAVIDLSVNAGVTSTAAVPAKP